MREKSICERNLPQRVDSTASKLVKKQITHCCRPQSSVRLKIRNKFDKTGFVLVVFQPTLARPTVCVFSVMSIAKPDTVFVFLCNPPPPSPSECSSVYVCVCVSVSVSASVLLSPSLGANQSLA